VAETKQKDWFEVGYGKPPRHSRFAAGRSGNPRGRQKGVFDVAREIATHPTTRRSTTTTSILPALISPSSCCRAGRA